MKELRINSSDNLGTQKVSKLIFSYFLTAFVGLVLNSVYNLTDTLFVSRGIGDAAMGGVALVMPFVFFQGAVSTMIGGGAAIIVAIKLGEKKYEEAGTYTFNAMMLFYAVAALISVIGLVFLEDFLKLFGAKDALKAYAKDYLTIILIGNVFSTGFSCIVRAEGKIVYGMMMWVVPIVLNIALDAVFVLGLHWGVRGAALATVVSQFTSFLFCVVFFAKFSAQKFSRLKIKFRNILAIAKIGLPALVQVSALSVIVALMNIAIGKIGGENEIIAFGYISKIIYYLVAPLTALSQAMSPVIGYNFGQCRHDRVDQTMKIGIKFALLYAVIALLLAEAMPGLLIKIFTDSAEIITIGKTGMRIVALSLIFVPIQIIVGAKYQAIGKTLIAVAIHSSSVIFLIAPIVLLGKFFGLNGIWASYTAAYALSATVLFFALSIGYLRKKYSKGCSRLCGGNR